jgi:hypothetical protein
VGFGYGGGYGYGGGAGWGYDPYAWGGGGWDYGKGFKGYGKGKGTGFFGGRYTPYGMKMGPTCSIKLQPIPDGLTSEILTETFKQYGEITSAVLMPGEPNYAYVNFVEAKGAEAALALGHIELSDVKCFIMAGKRRVIQRQEGGPSDGIGLFNLPFSISQEDLETVLRVYAGFKSVKMIMRPDGGFRGYAFAYFDTVDNATIAKDALNGTELDGKKMDVKFSAMSSEEAARQAAAAARETPAPTEHAAATEPPAEAMETSHAPDGVTGPTDTEAQTAEAAAAATAEALGGEGFGGDYGAFGAEQGGEYAGNGADYSGYGAEYTGQPPAEETPAEA